MGASQATPYNHPCTVLVCSPAALNTKNKRSLQFHFPLHKQWELGRGKEKENSKVDITEGKQPREKVLESRFLNSGHWGYFLCQCLMGVKRMKLNLSVRVNKTVSGSQGTFVKFQQGLESCLLWELHTNPVCCRGYWYERIRERNLGFCRFSALTLTFPSLGFKVIPKSLLVCKGLKCSKCAMWFRRLLD